MMTAVGGGTGIIQISESVTFVPFFVPMASTTFVPGRNVTGQVKMQFVLVALPCETPSTKSSTESQLA